MPRMISIALTAPQFNDAMIGKRFGIWTVLSIKNTSPWPWAWMKSDRGYYGRVSVHSLEFFDNTTKPIGE